MKIVILGAGQVGRTAAWQLAREEANEVTVVDTNEELLRPTPPCSSLRASPTPTC
jgi:trk system potassium uptake protein TrkA